MQLTISLRKALFTAAAFVVLGGVITAAVNRYNKPKTVLHVVTLYYKDGTTDEQKKQVLDALEKMASEVPGIRNVWLRGVKVQGAYNEKMPDGTLKARPFTDAFVLEFESEAALHAYADHPAHKAWEKVYIPLRARSATSDIGN